ncbi:hypothetical protein J6590_016604 [Homalodisca vitripennis]|nr:hypothetical protein J6590_016604 [Homalodisca vitripennis]
MVLRAGPIGPVKGRERVAEGERRQGHYVKAGGTLNQFPCQHWRRHRVSDDDVSGGMEAEAMLIVYSCVGQRRARARSGERVTLAGNLATALPGVCLTYLASLMSVTPLYVCRGPGHFRLMAAEFLFVAPQPLWTIVKRTRIVSFRELAIYRRGYPGDLSTVSRRRPRQCEEAARPIRRDYRGVSGSRITHTRSSGISLRVECHLSRIHNKHGSPPLNREAPQFWLVTVSCVTTCAVTAAALHTLLPINRVDSARKLLGRLDEITVDSGISLRVECHLSRIHNKHYSQPLNREAPPFWLVTVSCVTTCACEEAARPIRRDYRGVSGSRITHTRSSGISLRVECHLSRIHNKHCSPPLNREAPPF